MPPRIIREERRDRPVISTQTQRVPRVTRTTPAQPRLVTDGNPTEPQAPEPFVTPVPGDDFGTGFQQEHKPFQASVFVDAGRGIVAGVTDPVVDLVHWVNQKTNYVSDPAVWKEYLGGASWDEAVAEQEAIYRKSQEKLGGVGETVKALTEFAMIAVPTSTALNAAGIGAKVANLFGKIAPRAGDRTLRGLARVAEGEMAALVAENVAFDPSEERLSNLVQSVPALRNPVTDFLKADDDDPLATALLKQNVEALGAGIITAGVLGALGKTKQGIKARYAGPEEYQKHVDELLGQEPDPDLFRRAIENRVHYHYFSPAKSAKRERKSTRIWLSNNKRVSEIIREHHPEDAGMGTLFHSRVDIGDYVALDGEGRLHADLPVGKALKSGNAEKLTLLQEMIRERARPQFLEAMGGDADFAAPWVQRQLQGELPEITLEEAKGIAQKAFERPSVMDRLIDVAHTVRTDDMANMAEEAGFDSVVFRNLQEHHGYDDSFGDSVVVFDQNRVIDDAPSQVRGIKDPREGRITHQMKHADYEDSLALEMEQDAGTAVYIVGTFKSGSTVGHVTKDLQEDLHYLNVKGADDDSVRQIGPFESVKQAGEAFEAFRVDEDQLRKIRTAEANARKTDVALGRGVAPKQTGKSSWVIGEGTVDQRTIGSVETEPPHAVRMRRMDEHEQIIKSGGVPTTSLDEPVVRFKLPGNHTFPDTYHDTLELATAQYRRQRDLLYTVDKTEYAIGPGQAARRSAMNDRMRELQIRVVRNLTTPEDAVREFDDIRQLLDPDQDIFNEELIESVHRQISQPDPNLELAPITSADQINSWYEQNVGLKETKGKLTMRKVLDQAQRLFTDHSGPLKAKLLKEAGEAGQEAVMRFNLANGASSYAGIKFKEWRGKIYSALGKNSGLMAKADVDDLNKIIKLRREHEIAQYRPDAQVVHEGNPLGPEGYIDALHNMRTQIGAQRFDELAGRATQYFDAMREQLSDLRDNGLISQDEFEKLKRFDYQPREFIDLLDPIDTHQFGNKSVSVSSSGIEPLSQGSNSILETDSGLLLSQVITRTQGRIFKNRATKALAAATNGLPDGNKFLSRKKFPDSVGLSYVDQGVKKQVFLDREFADQWVTKAQTEGHKIAAFMGVPIQRMFQTGVNPEFALLQIPRDIAYIWATTNEYSTFPPLAAMQMMRDAATVGADALGKKGRYEDYLREGGGMSFLTHGAKDHTTPGLDVRWEKLQDTLSYLNSTSEIITRLMVRERAIRNGATTEQATAAARGYIDFDQGGKASKQVDVFIPYINASMQGLRGMGRAMKDNPVETSIKLGWFASMVGAHWMYNHMNHPEEMRQISPEAKNRYFHFPTGLKFRDNHGNEINLTAKVAVDHSLIPVKGVMESLMGFVLKGEVPDEQMLDSLKQGLFILGDVGSLGVGWAGALLNYASNFDFYQGQSRWKGPDVPAEQEVRKFPNRPTSQLAQDVAQSVNAATGISLSPVRMEGFAGDMLGNNIYTNGVSKAYTAVRGSEPYNGAMHQMTEQVLSQAPFLRKLLHRTYPTAAVDQAWERQSQEESGVALQLNQEIDKLSNLAGRREALGANSPEIRQLRELVKDAQPFDKQRAIDRFTNSVHAYKALKQLADPDFMEAKNPSWWLRASSLEPQSRAAHVFSHYQNVPREKQGKFLRFAQEMPSNQNKEFQFTLQKLIQEWGRGN